MDRAVASWYLDFIHLHPVQHQESPWPESPESFIGLTEEQVNIICEEFGVPVDKANDDGARFPPEFVPPDLFSFCADG